MPEENKTIYANEVETFVHNNVEFKLFELEIPKKESNRYVIFFERNSKKHLLSAGDYITAQKLLIAIKTNDIDAIDKITDNTIKTSKYQGYLVVPRENK